MPTICHDVMNQVATYGFEYRVVRIPGLRERGELCRRRCATIAMHFATPRATNRIRRHRNGIPTFRRESQAQCLSPILNLLEELLIRCGELSWNPKPAAFTCLVHPLGELIQLPISLEMLMDLARSTLRQK